MITVPRTKCFYSLFCPLVLAVLSPLIANGQQLAPKDLSIGFGSVQIGVSSSRTETLTNNGGTSIAISDVSASGTGFGLSGLTLPLTLNAGQSVSFIVTLNPVSAGSASGTVTVLSDGANPYLSIPLFGTILTPDQMKALRAIKARPECSLAKTNKDCKLIIDRVNPISPPPVQMYSDTTLTVIVKNPYFFERYFLDYQSGQATLSPDVTSAIVQGLLPSLGKIGEIRGFDAIRGETATEDQCAATKTMDVPSPRGVQEVISVFQACLAQLGIKAIGIYRMLEPFVAPDSLPKQDVTIDQLLDIKTHMSEFLDPEFGMSGKITSITGVLKTSVPDAPAIAELSDIQKLADAVANDLLGYSQRLTDLQCFENMSPQCNGGGPDQEVKNINASQECKNIIDVTEDEDRNKIQCISITSNQDYQAVYHYMVTRTITYVVNILNVVFNSQEAIPDPTKKKPLATIAINFADSPSKAPGIPFSAFRWEASAGAFFSTLPIRSFSVAPVFSGGQVVDNKVAQNILHPTVVPFAAANYRLSNDLGWTRWKSAIYLTGAIGVNPNTVSADFASGVSISWRSLMFSPLWHLGHDVRLSQGFYVGESLGAGFKGSLPTQTYWKSSFALGVSIRVPSLVGR